MTYQIKTIFPKEETAENNKLTERTINEFIVDMDSDEVKNTIIHFFYEVTQLELNLLRQN